MTWEKVEQAIHETAPSWQDTRDGLLFTCPAHNDDTPSASATVTDTGKVLVHCFAGCDADDIVKGLGLEMADLFPTPRKVAEYVYRDAEGHDVILVERWEPGPRGRRKSFKQYRAREGDWIAGVSEVANRPLYNLPEVLIAEVVYLVEGEKDADRLNVTFSASPLFAATTGLGGAEHWRPEWTEQLEGKHVIMIPDEDAAGLKRLEMVRKELEGTVASFEEAHVLEGKDISDHIDAGHTLADLIVGPKPRELRIQELDLTDIPPERSYVYRPFLFERSLVWMFGPSGHGKSIVMDKVMADLSKEGVHSILFEWEEGYQEGSRLVRLGADTNFVHVYNMKDEAEPVSLSTDWFALDAIEAVRRHDARLVVINPFILAAGLGEASRVDSWNAMVIEARELTKHLIEETGACVVIIDHAEEGRERAHGGRSKKWVSDLYLHVTKDQEEDYAPGAAYKLKVSNKKQAREWVPEVRATVIGKHHEGPLHVQWDYFMPRDLSEDPEEEEEEEFAPPALSKEEEFALGLLKQALDAEPKEKFGAEQAS